MKKRLILLVLALVCALTLSACGCKHETWIDADCATPKTCAECGETEGEALGHTWADATCETPKTCETCGETEGEALGHTWADATCEAPKTCSACGLTEGEALGHSWLDATTEAPKTCETCSLTEGERIITDERFTTAATADIQGKWACNMDVSGEMMDLPDFEGVMQCRLNLELGNDGTMSMYLSIENTEEFNAAMSDYLADTLYAELAASGLDQAAADAAMLDAYGMTVEEYVAYAMQSMDFNSLFGAININGVYYVDGSELYIGMSWGAQMEPTTFTLEGDTLTLMEDVSGMGAENSVFQRVIE